VKKYIQTSEGQKWLSDYILNMNLPEHGVVVEIKTGTRTLLQNNAMYKYFTILADALNEAGMEIRMEYLGKTAEIPWTPTAVKERLWLPIMQSMFDIKSTAKLDRKQVSEVYEVLSRWLATEKSILVDFPSAR